MSFDDARDADSLSDAAERIAAGGGSLGHPLEILAETSSTNDLAKRAAKLGAPHGATWVAETQTAGRGRQGRAWISPAGENLLFSVLLRVHCVPARLPSLALVCGLAARDAIARAAPGADVRIKWPNDVVVPADDGTLKKIAGVLVEATVSGGRADALIVGIGINVHTRDFPDEIAERATSVALLTTRPTSRAAILADTLRALDRDVARVAARGLGVVHARLSEVDALRGANVRSDDGDLGRAEGIDADGRLLVRREGGVLARWSAGEVHLLV